MKPDEKILKEVEDILNSVTANDVDHELYKLLNQMIDRIGKLYNEYKFNSKDSKAKAFVSVIIIETDNKLEVGFGMSKDNGYIPVEAIRKLINGFNPAELFGGKNDADTNTKKE